MNKFNIIIIVFILTAIILILWYTGILSSQEGRVRHFIAKAEKIMEDRNTVACTDLVAKNYQDKYGNNYEDVIATAHEFFNYYREISIKINKMTITFNEAKTESNLEIYAQVIAKDASGTEEKILDGEKDRFRLKLNKEDKKWKLTEIEFYEKIDIMK